MYGATNLTRFTHQPLDRTRQQIRLISITPQASGTIECHLRHAYLDENTTPNYRALSYMWSPPTPLRRIIVNGKLLEIRLNLYEFLEAFRARLLAFRCNACFPTETQWLWVDQVCINQTSISERNHQVRLMSDIYHRATYVYVWLGSCNGAIEEAMREIKSAFRRFYDSRRAPTRVSRRNRRTVKKVKNKTRANVYTDPWYSEKLRRAFNYFFTNEYWQRVWIVQEIMLARYIRIMCGRTLLSWEELRRFCLLGLDLFPDKFRPEVPDQLRWLAEHALVAKQYTYSDLFAMFSTSCCHDPRDKVYGLQGLLPPDRRLNIDYARSLVKVFRDAAWQMRRDIVDSTHLDFTHVSQGINNFEKHDKIFQKALDVLVDEAEVMIKLPFAKALAKVGSEFGLEVPHVYAHWIQKSDSSKIRSRWNQIAQLYMERRFDMMSNKGDNVEDPQPIDYRAQWTKDDDDPLGFFKSYPILKGEIGYLFSSYSRQCFRVRCFLRQIMDPQEDWCMVSGFTTARAGTDEIQVNRDIAFNAWLQSKSDIIDEPRVKILLSKYHIFDHRCPSEPMCHTCAKICTLYTRLIGQRPGQSHFLDFSNPFDTFSEFRIGIAQSSSEAMYVVYSNSRFSKVTF